MTISHRRRPLDTPPIYIQRSKAAAYGGKVHSTKADGGVGGQYSIKRIALVATSFIAIYLLLQKKGGSALIEDEKKQQQQIHNAIISSSIQNGTSNIQQSQSQQHIRFVS